VEFDGQSWNSFTAERSVETRVSPPSRNALAEELQTNSHCLFKSFEEAETSLNQGVFEAAEPGPYRIFAAYSVDWP
jgi:hypothetical protein